MVSIRVASDPYQALRSLKRVLLVSKRTRWEFASNRFDLGGVNLESHLDSCGFPAKRLKAAHLEHYDTVKTIVDALCRRGVEVREVRAPSLIASDLDGIDCVLTAGGDGTVLETAARIKTSRLPVVTINTDPARSHGHLCAFRMDSKESVEDGLIDKLCTGKFQPLLRSRIRVNSPKANQFSSLLALNEVFFAEKDASRPTVHETFFEIDKEGLVQRNSGVIACTGTGSTAWMNSACLVGKSDIQRLVKKLHAVGVTKGWSEELSDDAINRITNEMNEDTCFSPTSKLLKYCMREPVLNGWKGKHDLLLSENPKHGFAEMLTIRSRAWDGVLIFDGIDSRPVEYGELLQISIAPEEQSLYTVELSQ